VQILAGSLPLYLRKTPQAFPTHTGYLVPDSVLREKWRVRFAELGPGMKIGISWRGGHVSQTRKRSTELTQWEESLKLPGLHFINLQYGDCVAELSDVRERLGVIIHDWEDADPLKDLDNFSAQIAALDLVISVDNATVHMAGALGVEVWVLQPYSPDWRWLHGHDTSLWYPSLHHIRQSSAGDWHSTFGRVTSKLVSRIGRS
jgi:hypothetical protein